jgi:hypothetical protein
MRKPAAARSLKYTSTAHTAAASQQGHVEKTVQQEAVQNQLKNFELVSQVGAGIIFYGSAHMLWRIPHTLIACSGGEQPNHFIAWLSVASRTEPLRQRRSSTYKIRC